MSNDELSASAPGPRRTPRQGVGGSPVGSTLSIILAVIAVVAGFLILRNITDDEESGAVDPGDVVAPGAVTTTTIDTGLTTTIAVTTTTEAPLVTEGATVVVANGNSIGGSAGRMTKTLETAGFTLGTPINANVTVDESIVYYDQGVAGAEAVANSVARVMGDLDVLPAPSPPPTEDGTLGDGSVLLVLGNNQADKTLEELSEQAVADTTPPTGTAPAVSGSEDVVAPTSEAPAEGE